VKVQSAAALQEIGTLSVPYSREFGAIEAVAVRVRKPSGQVIETPAPAALDTPAPITSAAPTFTDLYLRTVNIQGLAVGDTLESTIRVRTRTLIPGQFWLEESISDENIVLAGELRVTLPASITANVKTTTGPQPTVSTAAGTRQYTWKYSNLRRASQQELAVKEYQARDRPADVLVTSFKDWPQVADAVRQLWNPRAGITPAIREKADELTHGLTTDADRLQAIYAFVATKIRYVAVSFGIGRLQPHPASEVLAAGFGDCKDKHILLVALLGAVGIAADTALIGAGTVLDPTMPSLGSFNHVISAVSTAGGRTWMDTTLEVAPLGQLIELERDKHVLLIPDKGAAALIKTPAAGARPNEWRIETTGSIDEKGRLTAKVEQVVTGDPEVMLRSLFRAVAQAKWPDAIRQLPPSDRFGGTSSEITIVPVEDTTKPFRFSYTYTVDDYSDWKRQRVSATFPFVVAQIPDNPAPVVPVALNGPLRVVSRSRLELPAGFTASLDSGSSPTVTLDRPFVKMTLTMSLIGHTFEAARETTFKVRELSVDQLASYREFYDAVAAASYEVSLKRIKPWAFGDTASVDWYEGASNAATTILQDAVSAANRKEHGTALAALDALTKAEPDNEAAWLMTAWVQADAGKPDRGLEILRRRIGSGGSASTYKYLADALSAAGALVESADVLARGRARYPADREFPLYVGETLVDQGRFQDALDVLTKVTGIDDKSPRLQWNLGRAYIGAHQSDLAVAALRRAAELDSSPFCLNNVAWELADAAIAVDDSLRFATRAVNSLEGDLGRISLDTVDAAALTAMRTLPMYWDTLAWAQFRRGALAEAESYLLASWDLTQAATYAEHLGEVYEARKDPKTAAAYYARALATVPTDASAAGHLASLVPSEADRTALIGAERERLAKARTITVSNPGRAGGTGEVFVLLESSGDVADVKFIAGPDGLRPVADTLRSAKIPSHIPVTSTARIVRRGVLSCDAGSTCAFVLLTVDRVATVK
jgi:tetratricopeptide (TPR) repeat protein